MKEMKYMFSGLVVLASAMVFASSANAAQAVDRKAVVDSIKAEKLYLPINTVIDRNLSTSSNRSYDASTIEKYPTLDLMNSFTGVIPGLIVTENNGATGTRYHTESCTLQMRAFTGITYIVDDVAIPENSEIMLSPEDIESITLITDIVDKVKYGPEAARGAIYIRTLRGTPEGRQIKFGFEKGIDMMDRFPEWCGAEDYARLNNLARENYNALTGTETYQNRFTEEDIEGYKAKDQLSWDTPNVDWRSLMLKNTRDFNKAFVLVRGGNDDVLYSANIDYANQGDVFAIGNPSNYNRFNAKMNIDLIINPKLDVNFSFIGTYSIRNTTMGNYSTHTASYEFPDVLSRVNNTPANEFPLYLSIDEETGKYIYPVSTNFGEHPYAALLEGGSYKESLRVGVTKATINYDLSSFLKNLKSETQICYNVAYNTRIGQAQDYMGYLFNRADYSQETTGHQGAKASDASTYNSGYLQGLQFHEKLYHDFNKGNHSLHTSLTYYRSRLAYSIEGGYHKQQNGIFAASYNFKKRYLLEIAANYAGTSARKQGHRYELFPSVGLGWIVSDESFLKDSKAITYLKLRGQAGVIGYEPFGTQYYWESYYTKGSSSTFGPYSANQWFGKTTYATTSTNASRIANDTLGWEKNEEWSVGFDAVLFNKLSIGYTHYNIFRNGVLEDVASVLPLFYGASSMYDTYDQYKYWGDEITINWSDRIGDFKYSIGGFVLHDEGKYVRILETTDAHLRKDGHGIGENLIYDYIGKFADQADIDNSTRQTFEATVYPGDFKYRDVNGDDVIDSKDRIWGGNTRPKFKYSVNLYLAYKNLDLYVVGTGKAGFNTFLNNSYYWNGDGDGNYSIYTRDQVAAGTYPRFSFVNASNNFRNSQYWMVKGDFFKIQCAELGYNINLKKGSKVGISQIRLFARGANLLTISGIKDCDPEAMSSGVGDYPLFKTYTGGFKFTF